MKKSSIFAQKFVIGRSATEFLATMNSSSTLPREQGARCRKYAAFAVPRPSDANDVRQRHWLLGNTPPRETAPGEAIQIISYARELQMATGITYRPHKMQVEQ
ncbi:hypothetical protein [Nisaea sp.]|uniref:hypothetical protein n=1 Tax=Nisaea sp. TaxID=2024842 RepID=UPI003B52C618